MIAVDTNILVRALTDDPDNQDQAVLATQLIQKAGCVFVPQIVQVEFFWVLERAYKLPKPVLLQALQTLQDADAFCLQNEGNFHEALVVYRDSSAGFADQLIVMESRECEQLWTFDRKLSTQTGVSGLTTETLMHFQKK